MSEFPFSAWLEPNVVKPYEECKETYSKANKSAPFREAIEAIEEFIKTGEEVRCSSIQ